MPKIKYSIDRLPGSKDIVRKEFLNGCVLLTRPNLTSPAVTIRGYLPPGAISDPEEKIGLSNFLSTMLMTGTEAHPFRELNNEIESIGASLAFGSSSLFTSFSGQCLREDLPKLLNLLTEILSTPTFPERHFQRIKTQILTAIAIQAENTAEMADQAYDRCFYREHPYARPDLGNLTSIQSISLEEIRAFHHKYYGPKGLVIAVSGGVSPEDVNGMVERTLANWQNAHQEDQPELPLFHPIETSIREHVLMQDKSQTDLVLGTIAPATMGPDYHSCLLGNSILGQFGMMGRIGETIREKSGLAYYAQSILGAGIGPSSWQVVAGVNPKNLEKTINLIKMELQRFINEPVTHTELSDVLSQLIGHLPLSFETNAGIAHALLNLERYQLDFDYFRNLPKTVENINREDVLVAARRYWDLDKLVITSAGISIS